MPPTPTSPTFPYFARLAGHPGPAVRDVVIAAQGDGDLWVEWTGWRSAAPEVSLYTVHHGGHTIPGPGMAFPAFLGRTEHRFGGITEAIRFFHRQSR